MIVGASGLVGSLVAAGLICQGNNRLILPVRSHHRPENIIQSIAEELIALNARHLLPQLQQVQVVELPPANQIQDLLPTLATAGVQEIIHSAGSVEYFNSANLKEVNIDLTQQLLTLGKNLGVERFIYMSTAFCSGFVDGPIYERLHPEPVEDPTEYTSSKRQAEALVANNNDLPFLIVRPSIVIGDSKTGRYCGKPYGLYQLWSAAERFLTDRWRKDFYAVAPQVKLPVVHQDAFLAGFMAAYRELPNNSFIHLVSQESSLPTVREVYDLWFKAVNRPERIHYYNSLKEATQNKLDRRQQLWMEFTAVNSDIAAHAWHFQTDHLDALKKNGLQYANATIDSIAICQNQFIKQSQRIQEYMRKQHGEFSSRPTTLA